MRKLILLLCLLFPLTANAQEFAAELDRPGLITINEELRKSSAGIRSLNTQLDDLTPISLANGGTGKALTAPSVNSVIYYDASTGSAFKALSEFVTEDELSFPFISRTTWSSATNSGNISITPGNRYRVIVRIDSRSSSGSVYVRFNSLSTTIYAYALSGYESSVGAYNITGATDSTGFLLSSSKTGAMQIDMVISSEYSDAQRPVITGTFFDEASTNASSGHFGGRAAVGATVTDFEIATTSNTSGEVLVYEYSGF